MSEYPQPRILVVDDFKPMSRIYLSLFKQIGLDAPDVALDAGTAFEMLSACTYSAVISDWHMPGETGLQLLGRVRATPTLSAIPFIMATVESHMDNVRAAHEAGATDYLLKPFKVNVLKAALTKAVPEIAAILRRSSTIPPEPVDTAYYRNLFGLSRA